MRQKILILISLFSVSTISSCDDEMNSSVPDWSTETHSNETAPNYETVFSQDEVGKLEITLTSEDWNNIKANMTAIYGSEFGTGGSQGGNQGDQGGNQGGGGNLPVLDTVQLDTTQITNPGNGGNIPDNGGDMGGGALFSSEEPDYVAVSLKANGKEWYKVGFRLKGNSSLTSIWNSGNYKLPFRLNFDEFENQYPEIKNQRFYGFKELSMSPGYSDNSLIREKLASDIFREAGVPAARTSFYRIYINFGDGLKYCGIYTMVEVVDDTMIKDQFGEDNGNIYKPESTFASFDESEFEKKNNKEAGDFSDVQLTISALNASERTTEPEKWRANLEKNFNADHFLKWLATNTTMVNWDSYGAMAHNHYLYNHSSKKLTWIPWDHNEAMSARSGINGDGLSFSQQEVTSSWPLIRFLMDDQVYKEKYDNHIREFIANVFISSQMDPMIDRYSNLIAPYVIGPEETEQPGYSHLSNSSDFTNERAKLKQHISDRITAAQEYLK